MAFSLWAFWDDNITRRPWKAFQSRFYRLDYAKAQAAYDEENKKLQADAKYQELAKKLAAAQASVTRGELGQKLAALEKQEVQATVRFKELDQEVKFIKSELEETWYEYDHAVQQKRNPKPYQDEIQQLEKAQSQARSGARSCARQTRPDQRGNQEDPRQRQGSGGRVRQTHGGAR